MEKKVLQCSRRDHPVFNCHTCPPQNLFNNICQLFCFFCLCPMLLKVPKAKDWKLHFVHFAKLHLATTAYTRARLWEKNLKPYMVQRNGAENYRRHMIQKHTRWVFVSIHGQIYTGVLVCISSDYSLLCPAFALCFVWKSLDACVRVWVLANCRTLLLYTDCEEAKISLIQAIFTYGIETRFVWSNYNQV